MQQNESQWYGHDMAFFHFFFRPVARAFGWADNVLAETLYDRLEKRHYPESKVKQNVEAGPKDVIWGSAQAGAGEHRGSTGRAGIATADVRFVSCLRQKFSRAASTKSGRHVAPGSQRSSQQNL